MNVSQCDRLDDYLLGALTADAKAPFEDHLAACVTCREEIEGQQAIDRLLAQGLWQHEPVPRGLVDRIARRVRAAQRRRMVRLAGGCTAAAVALVGIGLWLSAEAFHSGNGHGPPADKPVDRSSARMEKDECFPPSDWPPGEMQAKPSDSLAPGGVPAAEPAVQVTFNDPSEAILLPFKSESPNVTIVWICPTVKPVSPGGGPDFD